jgi:hypothetical protein
MICHYGGNLLRRSHAQFTDYPLDSVQNHATEAAHLHETGDKRG